MSGGKRMSYDVDTILRQQSAMESGRLLFDAEWLEVAERLLPRQAKFLGANSTPGARSKGRIFDEHAQLALKDFTGLVEGSLIPRGTFWMSLAAADDELMKIKRVAEWYHRKSQRLFRLRYAPKAGFQSQIHESFDSLGAFGNQALWVDGMKGPDHRSTGLFYRSIHVGRTWVRTNFQGRVDYVHRKFVLEARQALQMWPDSPPECAVKAARDGKEGDRHEYIHALFPRTGVEPGRLDAAGLPIGSIYLAVEGRQMVEEGGYRTMPLIYSRYETGAEEDYGAGPAMDVLPAVKACQAMMQSLVRAVQLGCEPPLGAPEEDVISGLEYKPRGVTYGAVDGQGNRLVQPLLDGADTVSAQALLEAVHGRIDRAFLKHLTSAHEELKSHVSASAFMQKAGDQGTLLLTLLGRQETELLDPMTEREVDIMADMGEFDDMPPEVREAGGAFQIKYDNPLNRLRDAGQAAGFFRTFEAAVPAIQARPDILDLFNFDTAIPELARINAVPPSWINSPEEMQAIRDGKAAKEAAAQTIEAAPAMSSAIKDIAQAAAAGGAGV